MTSPILRAALWMSGSISSFSFMAVAGRWLSGEYDTFEIMLYRSLTGVFFVLLIGGLFGTLRSVSFDNIRTHVGRNIFHFAGQNLWFFALTVIPLAQVFALEFTSPLWVLVLSPFILGERLTRVRVIAALVGFIGILVVTRPGVSSLNVGVLTAALSAICFALTIMLTKRLTQTDSLTSILFFLTALQCVFGLICAGYDGDIALPTLQSAPLLGMVGVAGLVAHFCLTKALSIAPATVVVPIDFIRLPVIAVVAMLVFSESLDVWVFVGAFLIFGANYFNIWTETRRA